MTRGAAQAFPTPGHNHERCRQAALSRARRAFKDKGLRLTPLRQQVFEQIAASHHAVGAYDVLERMAETGRPPAPISIYRAIDALLKAGVVHRLESRNAFFACHRTHGEAGRDGGDGGRLVLQCERCGTVAELAGTAVFAAIADAARAAAFTTRDTIVEVSGLCGHCGGAAEELRRNGTKAAGNRK